MQAQAPEVSSEKATTAADLRLVSVEQLQKIHRELDACQKVIWLAGCQPRVPGGFDPAYVTGAQEQLKVIEELIKHQSSWTHDKPTQPGAYWIRGDLLRADALIEVKRIDDELWCNLHLVNTEHRIEYGFTIDQLSPDFEWLGPLQAQAELSGRAVPDDLHPMQPIVFAANGVIRFKENRIVSHLLDFATPLGCGMNQLACMDFTDEERMQFAQLIGYSVSGYGELSYASPESVQSADKIAAAMLAAKGGAA